MNNAVQAWIEEVVLSTYEVGDVDPNPLFLESRVYQGSSGNVYPYGVIDSISDVKTDKIYQAIFIENDYIRVMLLPELGGRIHRAYDKVKQRDFVYYNDVVKPALVGLLGPWISGGIEFNWPQHHRPTTFMPVDFKIEHHDDGSATVWMGEIEHMYGLQVMAGFKLYTDKALIEITGKVYNGNETPRQFLWWSNPAVKGGDDHQSIFPPDVTAVYDHGKRDVSDFPIATGEYYKVDYSPGTDISCYRNLPVPTSYMADKSAYDFVGAYSHSERGGLLHIADHHVSPGKKQWTWGNCDFGLAWDRNLTDHNGPYIELMTGVYTDNQPDFTWLDSYEEKQFVQNFLPYSDLGVVHNANTQLALNLVRSEKGGRNTVRWGVYAIGCLDRCVVSIQGDNDEYLNQRISLKPTQSVNGTLIIDEVGPLTIRVTDEDGAPVLSYTEQQITDIPIPEPATAPEKPADVSSIEELYYIGQHLEQYHHATRLPEAYYHEGLVRDPNNYLCNIALAAMAFNRADYPQTVIYCDAALTRSHKFNKNPMCGKASFLRGCAREKQGLLELAYSDFYKSTWSGNCRDIGFYGAARIAMRQREYLQALELVEKVLRFNGTHYQAMAMKALLLDKLGRQDAAQAYIDRQLVQYPLAYALVFQRWLMKRDAELLASFQQLTSGRTVNAIHLANFYLSLGEGALALEALERIKSQSGVLWFYKAFLLGQINTPQGNLFNQAEQQFNQDVLFPNTLTEVMVLQAFDGHYFAHYLLGCFFYAKRDYMQAVTHWQRSIDLNREFAPSYRNLSVYSFNKLYDPTLALDYMERAFEFAQEDARVLFELDYLRKMNAQSPQQRLDKLELSFPLALKRDDLTAELLNLYNVTDQLGKARSLLQERVFHPWEGGEGKVTGQYIVNQVRQAFGAIQNGQYDLAIKVLEASLTYPLNLGEGRLVGQSDNDIHFWLGWCYKQVGKKDLADHHLELATHGTLEIGQSRYYNDQPADYLFYQAAALNLKGDKTVARKVYEHMINWAHDHKKDHVEPDFFAVSLPDLIVFDADLDTEQNCHCELVEAMGLLGLAMVDNQSLDAFHAVIETLIKRKPDHTKANMFKDVATLVGLFRAESSVCRM
ncbi:DUF5107 domain-containing protein [Photobacterium sp. DNB23_23_1]|uniref:DUF5107 domain-containing protein n=1 Tax=Photobacterium pectinilyticum TaxID=2906793 RepID=A0ABT1N1V7_9GAMM|nr:DUF5107 domain-containing protein [Photobacterium sp. ZSDE20]MCQ1058107.1 DUF5107 domain-containing protein [Photobacterium sp. ZSDE20]MDD1822640.1 DUF5107 domain-containing protein [Photobacterium sp. ZSDE20]